MKQSEVVVLGVANNADAMIASAGRMSTTKGNAISIYEKSLTRDPKENLSTINNVVGSGHTSTFEHVNVQLAFNDVSMTVEQFMIEFRLAAFTVKSRRYVDFANLGHFSPDFTQYENGSKMQELYDSCIQYLYSEYADFEQQIPIEDARFLLPHAFRSNFYCTLNLRELCKVIYAIIYDKSMGANSELVCIGKSLLSWLQTAYPYIYEYVFKTGKDYESAVAEKAAFEKVLKQMAKDMEEKSSINKDALSRYDVTQNRTENVEILEGPQNPEETICEAFLFNMGLDIIPNDEIMQKNILKHIVSNPMTRKRELEQVSFCIRFKNMSLPEITHITRHRMQSLIIPHLLDVCSYGRYVIPDSVVNAGLEDRYRKAFHTMKNCRDKLLELGFNKMDCCYLLLSGMTAPVQTTINANELYTFFRLRTCNRAQWEIQGDALELLRKLKERYPVLFSFFGPTCKMTGKCPEGKKSCGNPPKLD